MLHEATPTHPTQSLPTSPLSLDRRATPQPRVQAARHIPHRTWWLARNHLSMLVGMIIRVWGWGGDGPDACWVDFLVMLISLFFFHHSR